MDVNGLARFLVEHFDESVFPRGESSLLCLGEALKVVVDRVGELGSDKWSPLDRITAYGVIAECVNREHDARYCSGSRMIREQVRFAAAIDVLRGQEGRPLTHWAIEVGDALADQYAPTVEMMETVLLAAITRLGEESVRVIADAVVGGMSADDVERHFRSLTIPSGTCGTSRTCRF